MIPLEKHILEQYTDMQEEEKDLVRRIDRINTQIEKMEETGYMVADSVSCGKRGKKPLGTKKIQGFPYPEYDRKKSILKTYRLQLELMDQKLLELLQKVEEYISSIEDSRMRRIFRYRYIDGMNWVQISHRIKSLTADGCRSAHDRYLGIKK